MDGDGPKIIRSRPRCIDFVVLWREREENGDRRRRMGENKIKRKKMVWTLWYFSLAISQNFGLKIEIGINAFSIPKSNSHFNFLKYHK
jgi:hypothetical protein